MRRSLPLAYLFWAVAGFVGGHRFYLRDYGWGLIYLVTGGLFSLGWFADAFTLPAQVDRANCESATEPEPIATARVIRERKTFPVGAGR